MSFEDTSLNAADQWLDFLQSQRHFWPSMTTRFASLTPLGESAFRRERRCLQSKHLWDLVNIDWHALSRKLYVYKPTGLSRDALWQLLFVSKHRARPWKEQEYRGANRREVWTAWEQSQWELKQFMDSQTLFRIDSVAAIQGFAVENEAAKTS